jgi:phosphatidylinositol-3-phosphatase
VSDRYGYATHWRALTHPSEPNYLAMVGGSTFGVTDDAAPAANAATVGSAHSVFFQALAAGRTAGVYAESMPEPCALSDAYPYVVRHNPWTYFGSERGQCQAHDLSTASFADDARHDRLPDVSLLIPDVLHDAHDGTLAAADAWLRSELRPVLGSDDFTTGRLVVIVTADEDDYHSGNTVLTSVLTPRLRHRVVETPLDSTSLTRFIDQMLGVAPLLGAAHAPDLRAAFGL